MFLHLLPELLKKSFILHVFLIITFVLTGTVMFPLMLLTYFCFWKTNRTIYHTIIYHLSYTIWCQFTFISQWWGKLKIRLYIDEENIKFLGTESALIIMNHKYDIDWLVGWLMAEQYGCLGGTIPFVKDSFKHIPVIGWIWRFNGTVFLKRDWSKDKYTISNTTNDLDDFPKNYQKLLLLYPEGTRFTDEKLLSSNKVAIAKGIKPLKHCLLPRTNGFAEITKAIQRNVKVIYDLTLAFPSSADSSLPDVTLINILCGNLEDAHLLFRRYEIKDLPLNSDEGLSLWLHNLFYEKDNDFEFFLQNRKFEKPSFLIQRRNTDMIVAESSHLIIASLIIYFIKVFVLNWHLNTIIISIGCVLFCLLIVYFMIRLTQTETGSTYGK